MEAVEHPRDDRADDRERHELGLGARRAKQARERLAFDVLHHEEELADVGDDVEGADHVRVPNSRREPRLVEEHRDELGVRRELRVKTLDRDRAREPNRPDEATEVHGRHPAGRRSSP